MESQKVDMFMMANAKFFEGHQLNAIRERLLQLLMMINGQWYKLFSSKIQQLLC
jgi:hypothetical protein